MDVQVFAFKKKSERKSGPSVLYITLHFVFQFVLFSNFSFFRYRTRIRESLPPPASFLEKILGVGEMAAAAALHLAALQAGGVAPPALPLALPAIGRRAELNLRNSPGGAAPVDLVFSGRLPATVLRMIAVDVAAEMANPDLISREQWQILAELGGQKRDAHNVKQALIRRFPL